MSRNYSRDQLKISVGKILQTLGWNSVNSTPLEILTDILGNYMNQITRNTNNYANEFGCTEPNLDHLGLTFRDMGVCVPELEEYVKYVNFGPPPTSVPKYPIHKEDHLNFLKPGSKEVVTRPVHIHEHLPPMNPLLEGNKPEGEAMNISVDDIEEHTPENSQVFKKPADINTSEFKRPSFKREEEGSRPTREISSVMMTTSGFLSPAREGKLPEARTPITSVEPPPPLNNPPPDLPEPPKKPVKMFNKKVEKRKPKTGPLDGTGIEEKTKVRRLNNPKVGRAKHKLQNADKLEGQQSQKMRGLDFGFNDVKPFAAKQMSQKSKMDKTLAAARMKTEKLNTTITPIPAKPQTPMVPVDVENIDKLVTEPDKKKVNIFKKISNVKNEKLDVKTRKDDLIKQESRESSPDLVIDEHEVLAELAHLPNDVTIEPIANVPHRSPDRVEAPYFDDESQPGTPKTPEFITHSPPAVKERRKRKDSRKTKKMHRMENDVLEMELKRPKTPDAQLLPKMPGLDVFANPMPMGFTPMGGMAFPFHFAGPGLIPSPLTNPLFNSPYFAGQKPYPIPPAQNHPPTPQAPPPKTFHAEDVKPPLEKLPPPVDVDSESSPSSKSEKKNKEHKKEKKDKLKKRNKKDKIKSKAEKKKLKEEKKEKIKKEKKEKRKEKEPKDCDSPTMKISKITLKLKSPSPRPETPEPRKLNIKPIVKKEEDSMMSGDEDRVKRETSPGLAKISALVCGPPKPKSVTPTPTAGAFNDSFPSSSSDNFVNQSKKNMIKPIPKIRTKEIRREPEVLLPPAPPSRYIDAAGNEVWICPACGHQDDGSPMIGCDGCDAWYHWVCVGIQVPPDESVDWYCRHCLLKKNEDLQSDKQKKKRKKKEKKDY